MNFLNIINDAIIISENEKVLKFLGRIGLRMKELEKNKYKICEFDILSLMSINPEVMKHRIPEFKIVKEKDSDQIFIYL